MSKLIKFLLCGVVAASAISGSGFAGGFPIVHNPVQDPREYVEDQLLVRFKPGTSPGAMAAAHGQVSAMMVRTFTIVNNLQLVKLPPGVSVKDAILLYQKDKNVLYAEPNLILRTSATYPGDALFDGLWGLHNTGQVGGTEDADIDAPEAWDSTTGSSDVVIAVIDTGIDYTHEDLAANMWQNTDCDGDGLDDDGNGYIDDCYGIDTFNNDSDPMDDHAHGTHVAGTIGAVGGNAMGVVGVNWEVSLMACKFLSAEGWGSLDGAIACLEYVQVMKDRGVNIVATNNSWGGGGFSQALFDAIAAHLSRGMLFIAAAGNGGADHDPSPDFFSPSGYYLPNIVSVAATTRNDTLAFFSDYGRRTVHLGAPGHEILSTVPGNQYEIFSGTSMAAPQVAGVAALLKAQNPTRDWRAIKNLILAGGDTLGPLSSTITQRRLNAHGALTCSGAVVRSRLRPTYNETLAAVGAPVNLSVLHINCANPQGNVAVTVNPGGATVLLQDNGSGFDRVAGDGIYSGQWTPVTGGIYTLEFPDGDGVMVRVLNSYRHSLTSFNWRDITATGIGLNLGDDSSAMITSLFPVLFGGFGSFDHLFVSSNGHVNFTDHSYAFLNRPLPSPFHQTLVAPFWDDLVPMPGSFRNVFAAVRGAAPNRELVIEWRNVSHFNCPNRLTDTVRFQVVFFEGRSDILFQYADTIFGNGCAFANQGNSATIGVQINNTSAMQFNFNSPALPNNTAILWTTFAPAAGCTEVTAASSPATVRYTSANQIANIRVTVRNNRASNIRLESVTPQADERFTIVQINSRLPLNIPPRRSHLLTVRTRGPATGPFPVIATSPYFNIALDCGTLTTAGDRRLLVPLLFEGLQTELHNGYLRLEARGAGIAALRLELFDLTGRRLIDRRSDGSALTVPLERETGRRLANGIYLYLVTVRGVDGQVVRGEVRKLLLLR